MTEAFDAKQDPIDDRNPLQIAADQALRDLAQIDPKGADAISRVLADEPAEGSLGLTQLPKGKDEATLRLVESTRPWFDMALLNVSIPAREGGPRNVRESKRVTEPVLFSYDFLDDLLSDGVNLVHASQRPVDPDEISINEIDPAYFASKNEPKEMKKRALRAERQASAAGNGETLTLQEELMENIETSWDCLSRRSTLSRKRGITGARETIQLGL